MDNYVLVLKTKRGYRIGIKRYNKIEAIKRVNELKFIGINMEVMLEQEAFGNQ